MSLNISDYQVLNSIIDRDNEKGMSKLRGVTVMELVDITGFSSTKVRNSLKKLIDKGFVAYAIKRVRSDAFHITEDGLHEMMSVGEAVVNIDNDATASEENEYCVEYDDEDETHEVLDVEYSESEGDVE